MDWDKLRIFHIVAESGSFTRAGAVLDLSQSAVSRQIRALEQSLNVPLFHRHARGLILTEQGELLHKTSREVFARLSVAEAMLSESKERPKGPLRITTTVGFGSMWLTGQIGQFLDKYAEINVILLVADAELDLSMRQADVAIRMAPPRQPDLIQRHLFTGRFGVFATADYLNRFGTPRTLDDLVEHRLITYGERRASGSPPCPPSSVPRTLCWCASSPTSPRPARTPISSIRRRCGSRAGWWCSAISC
jgi:DNA-binding transcriptional LysR family regulator